MTEYIRLKEANCKNCYKCIRHCPVKSISFSENQAHIISNECILCGQCFLVCPQNAKVIRDDSDRAKALISDGEKLVVSLAPSFVASYPDVGIKGMENALKKLGFFAVEETALGATIVKKQYDNLVEKAENQVIISSCCPTVNLMIQKHFPDVLPYLAPVISPMVAHCRDIKDRYPEAKTVFIGPCISKKVEGDDFSEDVDCVLTFEELSNWLRAEGIEPVPAEEAQDFGRARIFPTAGGILKSMFCTSEDYSYISVDGLENCICALRDLTASSPSKCFIEMSACAGSCIGGPVAAGTRRAPLQDYISVEKYSKTEDFPVDMPLETEIIRDFASLVESQTYPNELQLDEILRKMGKRLPSDELNCGSCGYNSCREKAIAVFQGKADLSMCTPFLRDKAETFSNNILKNSPNGIIALGDKLDVQQINTSALNLLNIKQPSDIIGANVACILDPLNFTEVLRTGRPLRNKRVYLAEYRKYVELSIDHDSEYRMLLCILRDVTEEETERQKKEEISLKTIDIADKVIKKQMRVVQDIASLLGETTAETKVALTKLKESLEDE